MNSPGRLRPTDTEAGVRMAEWSMAPDSQSPRPEDPSLREVGQADGAGFPEGRSRDWGSN